VGRIACACSAVHRRRCATTIRSSRRASSARRTLQRNCRARSVSRVPLASRYGHRNVPTWQRPRGLSTSAYCRNRALAGTVLAQPFLSRRLQPAAAYSTTVYVLVLMSVCVPMVLTCIFCTRHIKDFWLSGATRTFRRARESGGGPPRTLCACASIHVARCAIVARQCVKPTALGREVEEKAALRKNMQSEHFKVPLDLRGPCACNVVAVDQGYL
jgi:hypothetical protein